MQIRAATVDDAPGMARVHVDTWRTAYRDIFSASFLAGLSYEARTQRWRDNLAQIRPQQFTLVAEHAGVIVAFAGGGPERDGMPGYDGEIYAVYVLPTFQHHGLGRRLMAVCVHHLTARGFSAVMLWALEANRHARTFYELLGGRPIGRKMVTIGDTPLAEVAYGWPDLAELCRAAGPVTTTQVFGVVYDPDRDGDSAPQ
jgi:GNAT superfamily N-acetyltransferase